MNAERVTTSTPGPDGPTLTTVDDEWELTLEPLDVEECWEAVFSATPSIGRIAFIDDEGQQLLPVNYAVARRSIVVRTTWDSKLSQLSRQSAGGGGAAAFEVDHIDAGRHTGWSVMIQGRVWPINRPDEPIPDDRIQLRPWAAGDRDCWIRLVPTSVTGRTVARRRTSHPTGPLPYMPPD